MCYTHIFHTDLTTGTGNPFGSGSDDEDTDLGQWGGVRGVSGYHVSRLSPVRAEEERRQDGSSRGGSPWRAGAQGIHCSWRFYIWASGSEPTYTM